MILNAFFSTRTHKRKLAFLSGVGLSLWLTAPVCAAPVAPETAAQQLDRTARQAAMTEIRAMGAKQQWMDSTIQVEPIIPPEASALAPCAKPLRAGQTDAAKKTLLRLRYEIVCPGNGGWTLGVTVKTSVKTQRITSAQTLERGRVIGPEDVVLSEQSVTLLQEQIFTTPQEVVGHTVKRRINAGQTITPALLDQPVLVNRGQRVALVINHQGIEARTTGEALKQGRKGETIRVRNISSQRVVDGKVEAEGVVRVSGQP